MVFAKKNEIMFGLCRFLAYKLEMIMAIKVIQKLHGFIRHAALKCLNRCECCPVFPPLHLFCKMYHDQIR